MKKTVRSILFFLFAVVMISGCASTSHTKYVPDWSRTKPEQAAGTEHLVDKLARGEKSLVTFVCFLPPALNVEMRGDNGYFTMLALVNDKVVSGDVYFERMDTSGRGILRAIMPGKYNELISAPHVVTNMDGGFAFTLTGKRIIEGSGDTQYDVYRFAKEPEYRRKFFELYGLTPLQMNQILRAYFENKGIKTRDGVLVKEVLAGTQDWIDLEQHMFKSLGNSHELHNGKNYLSRMSLSDFQVEANRAVGFTATQRYTENIRVPLYLLATAFTPVGLVGTGARIVTDVANANIKTDWPGPYARATGKRKDQMEQFEWQALKYLNLLEVKEEENRYYKSLLEQNKIKY